MLGVQYTYFAAIEYGNAAVATVLQYLGPAIITCFFSDSRKENSFSKRVARRLIGGCRHIHFGHARECRKPVHIRSGRLLGHQFGVCTGVLHPSAASSAEEMGIGHYCRMGHADRRSRPQLDPPALEI